MQGMLALALLASICIEGQATDDEKFDVRLKAAIGEVMVERLGDLLGVEIRAHKSIADEPLIFNVQDVTFEQFREISAQGLDATWRRTTNGWELYRSKEQIDEEVRRFYDYRKTLIVKEMAEKSPPDPVSDEQITEWARKVLLDQGDDDDRFSRSDFELYYINATLPRGQVMPRIWEALGADLIASIPIDERWVFTEDGRQGTHRLPELKSAKETILSLRPKILSALHKNGAWSLLNTSYYYEVAEDLDSTPVVTTFLQVAVSWEYLMMTLVGYDESGKKVVDFYDSIEVWKPTAGTVHGTIKDVKVAQSAISRAVSASKGRLDERNADSSSVFWDFLSSMPESEPLALDISDLLLALSDELAKPFVARLSNDLVDDLGLVEYDRPNIITDGEIDLKSGIDWIEDFLDLEETTEGLIKGRPSRPPRYQLAFPRKAIARYVQKNLGSKLIDVQELLALLKPAGSITDDLLIDFIQYVENPTTEYYSPIYSVIAWQNLSPAAKQESMKPGGVTVPFGSLGGFFRVSIIEDLISQGEWNSVVHSAEAGPELYETILDFLPFDIKLTTLDDLPVQVQASYVPVVQALWPFDDQEMIITPSTWANTLFMIESKKMQDPEGRFAATRFWVERALKVDLYIDTPVGRNQWTSEVEVTTGNTERLRLEQLPASWFEEFQLELEKLRKREGTTDIASLAAS